LLETIEQDEGFKVAERSGLGRKPHSSLQPEGSTMAHFIATIISIASLSTL
jgi:hypothetical protein